MINVRGKLCIISGCDIRSSCGMPGTKTSIYCGKHKLHGYVNVTNRKCRKSGCDKQVNYGLPGQSARYCFTHKSNKHVLIHSQSIAILYSPTRSLPQIPIKINYPPRSDIYMPRWKYTSAFTLLPR